MLVNQCTYTSIFTFSVCNGWCALQLPAANHGFLHSPGIYQLITTNVITTLLTARAVANWDWCCHLYRYAVKRCTYSTHRYSITRISRYEGTNEVFCCIMVILVVCHLSAVGRWSSCWIWCWTGCARTEEVLWWILPTLWVAHLWRLDRGSRRHSFIRFYKNSSWCDSWEKTDLWRFRVFQGFFMVNFSGSLDGFSTSEFCCIFLIFAVTCKLLRPTETNLTLNVVLYDTWGLHQVAFIKHMFEINAALLLKMSGQV